LRTSCAEFDVVLSKMLAQMSLSGNSVGTQKPYLRAVRDLMESCKSIPELLTADEIKAHLVSFRGKISSSALNLRVCGIKFYFRNVVRRLDLVVDIPNPRVAKYVQDVLSEDEILVMLGACRSLRERAMIELLFDSGLRSREVCGLRLCDFNRVAKTLTVVNGKGEKMRTVPYSMDLRGTLAAYFKSLKEDPSRRSIGTQSVFLFENKENPGSAITIRGVQYIVKEVLKRSKLKKEVHPHTFRHSYAIHYLNNGGNLLRLQQLLGHENIETTFHYLKFCSIPLTDTPTPLTVMLTRKKPPTLEARIAFLREELAQAIARQEAEKGGNV
jgi:integrase/recombinase XerD